MNRLFLPVTLVMALLVVNSCTSEQVHTNSGRAGASAQSTPTPPNAAGTAIPSPPATPDSTPSPAAPPTRESTPPPTRTSGSKLIQITDGNYDEEVARARTPVLITFGAPWSPPVRIFAPIIEAVADEYAGRVKFGEVNVDENAGLAKKFDIKGIPTLVIIKNGSERERVVGITSKESISRLLDRQLGSNP